MENEKSRRWLQKKSILTIDIKKGDVVKKIPAKEAKISLDKLFFPPPDEKTLEIADERALKAETIKQRVLFMEHSGIVDFLFETYKLEGKDSKVAIILGLISDIKPNTISRELGNLRRAYSEISVDKLKVKRKEELQAQGKLKPGMEKIIEKNSQKTSKYDKNWLEETFNLLEIEPLIKILSEKNLKNKK